ncbi:32 kDa beta-galactoside-binding lectin-like [Physella acuta]|uniref:32 kDa beta-galactoside-binding lectin-like n=1 Tax=Physella acuta TaxID=109671 RepID=UPI0027DD362A|nr:32 kDa beta-galactoside-binding lectin-like [Physella acuta]
MKSPFSLCLLLYGALVYTENTTKKHKVPFHKRFYSDLFRMRSIVILGQVPHNANRFSIRLCVKKDCIPNVALLFNPRFIERKTVMARKMGQSWSNIQVEKVNPFSKGQRFQMVINIRTLDYEIYINNKYFAKYPQNYLHWEIGYINVREDVTIDEIQEISQELVLHHTLQPGVKVRWDATISDAEFKM